MSRGRDPPVSSDPLGQYGKAASSDQQDAPELDNPEPKYTPRAWVADALYDIYSSGAQVAFIPCDPLGMGFAHIGHVLHNVRLCRLQPRTKRPITVHMRFPLLAAAQGNPQPPPNEPPNAPQLSPN